MTTSEGGMPATLRTRVFADLRPVRPLAAPWKRASAVVPLAIVLVVLVQLVYGTRRDLGALLLWGASALQMVVGVGLAVAALREVIPDRTLHPRLATALLAAGVALALGVTGVAWLSSGTTAPASKLMLYWKYCFLHTFEFGLPVLGLLLGLAARGVMWRPKLMGAMAGLSAGLIADASWRTFCSVSEPTHVLSSHLAAVVTLAVVGAACARLLAAFRSHS